MAKEFNLESGENLLKEDKGFMRKGKVSADFGTVYLTDKRLVFEKGGAREWSLHLAGIFGGVAGLFGAKMAQKGNSRLKINAPLSEITDVQRSKFGRNESMMRIETASGEVFEIGIDKVIHEWIEAISDR
jgi:hypothetical protein